MDTKEKQESVATQQRPRRPRDPAKGNSGEKPVRRRTEREQTRPLQDVVYIPPKPFIRNRLLLRLATVAAIVLALVLAMFVFFRVEHIQVSGMDQYTAWDIKEATGIKEGDSLFSLGLPGAAAKIKALPYIKDVRIGIKLPNMVMIEITEVRVTYAVKAQNDDWWLMDSGGQIVSKAAENAQDSYTKILGVHLLNPKEGQQAVAQETAGQTVDEEGNTIPVTVTAAMRLKTALEIANHLEANGILGKKGSIDVNDMGNLQMWYEDRYQIKLGNDSELAHKINQVKGAIDGLTKQNVLTGVLDATFKDNNSKVIHKDFQ
jgi:cell division protein FtsQ